MAMPRSASATLPLKRTAKKSGKIARTAPVANGSSAKSAPAPATPATSPTKLRLLHTAIDLIWEHNYSSVSVDDICRRAGILKGSFYHFFPSKADLAVAALEERWVRMVHPRLEEIFSPAYSPYGRLSRYYDMVYDNQKIQKQRVGRICGCAFASIGSEQSNEDEKIRAKSQEVFKRYVHYIAGALRDAVAERTVDIPPGEATNRAHELYTFILGVLVQARVENDLQLVKHFKSSFLRISGVRETLVA